MIIATDDTTLATQIHMRLGAEVVAHPVVELIAEYPLRNGPTWIIDPLDLAEDTWLSHALYSRGAVGAHPYDSVESIISYAIQSNTEANRVHNLNPTYIGKFHPDVIFVGERPNPNSKLSLMTFQQGPTGCGDYLWRALQPVRDSGAYIGLVNSHIGDEPQLTPYDHARYVALGKVASEWLTDQGIRHGVVDHPQYVKRFHYDQIDEYAANLAFVTVNTNNVEKLIR